ncbi:hypothetical protein AAG570_009361 [Ranatra chinensis]|uniref:Major facilitator superfamily (MFS) profile domain-containing protein n=1 Tax=Ranatra chinensis TaxID=642074 RepID=A0ABD0YP38_9HEMI
MAVYFYLLEEAYNLTSLSYLPVTVFIIYNTAFCIGMGPIPWTIIAELFPIHLKGVAVCIIGFVGWLLSFTVMKCYQNFETWLGAYTVFLFLGVTSVVCMAGVWFLVPDTRGMSLLDIQQRLKVANLVYLSTGSVMSWPSPTLPKLRGSITPEEGSWIGALSGLGAAAGPFLVAASLDTLGRKMTLLIDGFIFLVSWIILLSSRHLAAIYIARVVGGIGVGASFCAASLYTAEIADDAVRGALGSVNQVFSGVGMLIQYSVGPYVGYTTLVVVSACVTLLFALVFAFMPESPYHLVNKGHILKAEEVIRWVRHNPPQQLVDKEIAEIEVICCWNICSYQYRQLSTYVYPTANQADNIIIASSNA